MLLVIFVGITDTKITLAGDTFERSVGNMVEFGEQLRRAREKKGLTQQTLAEELYVTRQTVSHWERGDRYPDLLTTKRLSDILEVSLDDLLSGNEMNKVVERNPVIENKVANNVMIFFYSIIIFSLLSIMGSEILTTDWKYITGWAVKCNDTLSVVWVVGGIIGGTVTALIFSYGLINAIKGTLFPKRIGVVIAAYYVTFFIEYIENMAEIHKYGGGVEVKITSYIPYLFDLLLGIIGVVTAVLYFIRKNNKMIVPVLLVVASIFKMFDAIVKIVHYIFYMAGRFSDEVNQFHDAIPYENKMQIYRVAFDCISKLLIYGLIIYQVIVLYRKRKIAADITAEAAVES